MEEKNNEMIELVETNEDPITTEVEVEESGMGTGLAMLIGSGLTLAVLAGVRKGKELWSKHKAKKAAIEDDAVVIIENGDEVDPSDTSDDSEEIEK